MATSRETIEFLLDQLSSMSDRVHTRSMFGEYALYCDNKVVGFVCDDQLFVKINPAAQEIAGDAPLAPPYPGAKMYWLLDQDEWEDRARLEQLITLTADFLPAKPLKRPKGTA